MDIGQGVKATGYYVQRSCGLFPAPLPQDSDDMERVERLFQLIGVFFAKCIQDSRLVDIPLSRPLLKLLCMGDVSDAVSQNYRELLYWRDVSPEDLAIAERSPPATDDDLTPTENKDLTTDPAGGSVVIRKHSTGSSVAPVVAASASVPWYAGLLTQDDFELVDPHRACFLRQLRDLSGCRNEILSDPRLDDDEKKRRLDQLTLDDTSSASLDDLG